MSSVLGRSGKLVDRRRDRLALLFIGLSATVASLGEATVLVVVSLAALRLANDTATPVNLPFGFPVDELGTPLLLSLGLAALVVRLVSLLANTYLSSRLTSSTLYRWRRRVFVAYQRSDWPSQASQDEGYLQTITQTYVSRAAATLQYLAGAISAGVSFASFILSALLISPLGAFGLLTFGATLYILFRPLSKVVRDLSTRHGNAAKEYARLLGEASSLALEHRVLGAGSAVTAQLDDELQKQTIASRRQSTVQLFTPHLYTGIGYVAILLGLAGATRLETSDVALIGAIVLLMIRSLGYGQTLQGTIQALASSQPFVEELLATVERLEASPHPYGNYDAGIAEEFTLRDVRLAYGDAAVVDDVSLTIRAGEAVGIIGPSGGGKSTLALSLLGLVQPAAGTYEINGVPACQYSEEWWKRNVSFVPQRAELFDGSVGENIQIHRPEIPVAAILEAANSAHLAAELGEWTDGLTHQVGPRGGRLSGGQRQRVCIARALAGNPRLLVLDEPTSALDVSAEDSITAVLSDLRHTCTMVVVAHRISTLAFCDRVLLVENGRVVEIGSGEEIQSREDLRDLCNRAMSDSAMTS